jgi:hypothetical protein
MVPLSEPLTKSDPAFTVVEAWPTEDPENSSVPTPAFVSVPPPVVLPEKFKETPEPTLIELLALTVNPLSVEAVGPV